MDSRRESGRLPWREGPKRDLHAETPLTKRFLGGGNTGSGTFTLTIIIDDSDGCRRAFLVNSTRTDSASPPAGHSRVTQMSPVTSGVDSLKE